MPVPKALLISTTCQRFGLGTFLCCFVVTTFMGTPIPMNIIALATLFLLGVGGIASAFHLGKPKRFFNAFANPRSHLTQEAFITPFLGIALFVCGIDGFILHLGPAIAAVYWVAVMLSLIFLISTGLVYHLTSRPAWNTYLVFIIFLLTAAEAGTITTLAILFSLGVAAPVGLVGMTFITFIGCLLFQFLFTVRLKSVGYGVNVYANQEPYKTTYTLWFIFSLTAMVIALIAAVALQSVIVAVLGVICTLVGIVFWTVLSFNVALKVKMFPMYRVDLNLNM